MTKRTSPRQQPDSSPPTVENATKALADIQYALDQSAIVAITDVQGNITYVNHKFCEISKYSRNELLGKNHRILKSTEHPPEFFVSLWKTIASGKVWRGEIKNLAKDGSFYWVDTTIVPLLKEDGKPYQYVSIRYEITRRKVMEAEIRQLNEELEERVAQRTAAVQASNHDLKLALFELKESERLRETFISAMTHDLRTPLVAQKRAIELLIQHAKTLPPKLATLTDRMLTSNDDLLNMVNRLLEINQYKAGKVHLNPEPVNLPELVTECFRDVGVLADTKKIVLKNSLPENLPIIRGDRHQMKRVLMNLIGNALEHLSPKQMVWVESLAYTPGMPLEIWVCDNGPGIPLNVLPNLFEKYFVVQRTRKKIGSGLGLSICKMIMELHGGRITVESEVDKGTRFCLQFPQQALQQDRLS